MRGLWWKTWRESWLPVEVAIPVTFGLALALHSWTMQHAETRPLAVWFVATVRRPGGRVAVDPGFLEKLRVAAPGDPGA